MITHQSSALSSAREDEPVQNEKEISFYYKALNYFVQNEKPTTFF